MPNWSKAQYEEWKQRRDREEYDLNRAYTSYCELAFGSAAPGPKPKPPVRHDALATAPREDSHSARVHVRITSKRRRLIDPDNLCPKYFLDCVKYAELIRDDRPQDITLEVRQEKVQSKADECTVIELEYAPEHSKSYP